MANPNFKALRHTWIFPATYNFEEDDVGSAPAGWVGCTTSRIIPSLTGRKNVFMVEFPEDPYNSFTARTSGVVELLYRVTDANDNIHISFKDADGVVSRIEFGVHEDKWKYMDFGFAWKKIPAFDGVCDPVDHAWYHIKITFDCGTDLFSLVINEVNNSGDLAFCVVAETLGRFCINTGVPGVTVYVDDIGYDWDPEYDIGDNLVEILEDITDDIFDARIYEELYTVSYGWIKVKGDVFSYQPGHEIDFYDRDNVLSWKGIILSPEYTLKGESEYISKISLVGMDSQFENMLRKNFTTARDSDYIVKYIIDNMLTRYHSYNDEIDNFTITYKYDMKKNILKMFYYLAMLEKGVIHYKPNGEIFFNKA